MWFPNLYGIKQIKLHKNVQDEEYYKNKKKKKKKKEENIKKAEATRTSFNRMIINRYYRNF